MHQSQAKTFGRTQLCKTPKGLLQGLTRVAFRHCRACLSSSAGLRGGDAFKLPIQHPHCRLIQEKCLLQLVHVRHVLQYFELIPFGDQSRAQEALWEQGLRLQDCPTASSKIVKHLRSIHDSLAPRHSNLAASSCCALYYITAHAAQP